MLEARPGCENGALAAQMRRVGQGRRRRRQGQRPLPAILAPTPMPAQQAALTESDGKTSDGREYFQYDTGMASAFLMLAATARNLEAHAVAGFEPQAARQVLALPADAQVITLTIVGRHRQQISPSLTDWQVKAETQRPPRLPFAEFATIV